jgi:5-methylthioadenosine/S-adenosylhomocysteine deaminase
MEREKYILAGTLVATPRRVLSNQVVTVKGERIADVGPIPEALFDQLARSQAEVIDARDKIVMPGLVNAHSHHTEVLQRSLRDTLPFELWRLERRGVEDALEPGYEELLTANLICLLESLKHGTTSVLHHLSRRQRLEIVEIQACIDAAKMLGNRVVIAPSISDVGWKPVMRPEEDPPAARTEVESLIQALDLIENGPQTLGGLIGPTSIHTCSDGLLKRCVALAKERSIGIHTHFLETRLESTQRSANGETVVERACRLGLFEVSVSLAHTIHVSEAELDELASRNAKVVHNPCSNLKLGSGFAKIREMLARGIVIGLGSDGGDTSDGYSLFDQMKMAAIMRRCSQPDFNAWISSVEAFAMATSGGAESLGVRSGKIERDFLADICILKPGVRMWPHADMDIVKALVYAENGSSVDTVLVGGEVVLKDGESTRFKQSDLQKRVQDVEEKVQLAKAIWENQKKSQDFKDRSCALTQAYQEAVKSST